MSNEPLRQIVVDGDRYLFRVRLRYEYDAAAFGTASRELRAAYGLTVYRADLARSPLRIKFTTWECAVTGGPLHNAQMLDLAAPFRVPAPDAVGPSIVRVNIYRPHAVAHVIRAALADGWRPDSTRSVRVIDDGLPLLYGYVG